MFFMKNRPNSLTSTCSFLFCCFFNNTKATLCFYTRSSYEIRFGGYDHIRDLRSLYFYDFDFASLLRTRSFRRSTWLPAISVAIGRSVVVTEYNLEIWIRDAGSPTGSLGEVGNIIQNEENRSENWTKLLRIILCLLNWKFNGNVLICSNVPKSLQFFCFTDISINARTLLILQCLFSAMRYKFFILLPHILRI